MAGAKHKQKGSRVERRVVAELQKMGFSAQRVPNSGSSKGLFDGDIHLSHSALYKQKTAEVKARANGEGWKTIRAWMQSTDMIFLVEDRKDPLVVLTWAMFQEMATALGESPGSSGTVPGPVEASLDNDPIVGGAWDSDCLDEAPEAGEH